jgi:hypothetical protein
MQVDNPTVPQASQVMGSRLHTNSDAKLGAAAHENTGQWHSGQFGPGVSNDSLQSES